eukprot:6132598-Pyramimonas_sp.AAC.1
MAGQSDIASLEEISMAKYSLLLLQPPQKRINETRQKLDRALERQEIVTSKIKELKSQELQCTKEVDQLRACLEQMEAVKSEADELGVQDQAMDMTDNAPPGPPT